LTVVLAAAFMPGCEDSVLMAPADSDFIIVANPPTVTIDEPEGETEGETIITVQIFDASNFPMEGVAVTFTATGGRLSLTAGGDTAPPPVTLETDASGMATVYLAVTLGDDSTVDVTARSGTLSASVTVTKNVLAGNMQPEAYISAIPLNRQRINVPVNFSGANSLDPDDDDITCYKWTITSSIPSEDKVIQGHLRVSITQRYSQEQTLNVTLHVSDDPDYGSFCNECDDIPANCGASDSNFSPYFDSLDPQYEIVCDLSDPIARGGSDQVVTLVGGTVDVFLNGSTSSDPESTSLEYDWDCGNGTPHINTPTATCTYTSASVYNATLSVTNDCNMTATDTVRITVSAP
jgi:hypothetical protein